MKRWYNDWLHGGRRWWRERTDGAVSLAVALAWWVALLRGLHDAVTAEGVGDCTPVAHAQSEPRGCEARGRRGR